MNQHKKTQLSKRFRQLAEQEGKPFSVRRKHRTLRIEYGGKGVPLPHRAGPHTANRLLKRLGFGT